MNVNDINRKPQQRLYEHSSSLFSKDINGVSKGLIKNVNYPFDWFQNKDID